MSPKEQNIWHAKRLITLASKSAVHTSRRIRAGLPAHISLLRTDRLMRLANAAWEKAIAMEERKIPATRFRTATLNEQQQELREALAA